MSLPLRYLRAGAEPGWAAGMCAACSKAPGPLCEAFYKVSAVIQPVPEPVIPFGRAAWDGCETMGMDRGGDCWGQRPESTWPFLLPLPPSTCKLMETSPSNSAACAV